MRRGRKWPTRSAVAHAQASKACNRRWRTPSYSESAPPERGLHRGRALSLRRMVSRARMSPSSPLAGKSSSESAARASLMVAGAAAVVVTPALALAAPLHIRRHGVRSDCPCARAQHAQRSVQSVPVGPSHPASK